MFVFNFMSADKLFGNLGPKYEGAFWPWMLLLYGNCSLCADLCLLCPWLKWLLDLRYVCQRHVLEELEDNLLTSIVQILLWLGLYLFNG